MNEPAGTRRTFPRQLLLALGVLVVGAAGAGALIWMAPQSVPSRPPTAGPLVEVVEVQPQEVEMTVRGFGTVRARARADIVPEVSGRVVEVHPQLVSGGVVPAGQRLVVIDPTDYRLSVSRAAAQLEQAKAAMSLAEARIAEAQPRQRDARSDLERTRLLFDNGSVNQREVDKATVAYDIAAAQVRAGQSSLVSAQAEYSVASVALEQAEANLKRIRLTMPFAAVVVDEQVSVGQYVVAGQKIGSVYDAAIMEIKVPLEDDELQWLTRTPIGAAGQRLDGAQLPSAVIEADFLGARRRWEGRVVRTEAEIDQASRMVQVVIEVNSTDSSATVSTQDPAPLVPGIFVDARITGRRLQGVFVLPRRALRRSETSGEPEIWILEGDRLRQRPVKILRADRASIYLRQGLVAGEAVIVSPLDTVTDGMAVRRAPPPGPDLAGDGGAAKQP